MSRCGRRCAAQIDRARTVFKNNNLNFTVARHLALSAALMGGALSTDQCCIDADLALAASRHRQRLKSLSRPAAKRCWFVQAPTARSSAAAAAANCSRLGEHLLRQALAPSSGGAELVVVAPLSSSLTAMRALLWRWASLHKPDVTLIAHPDLVEGGAGSAAAIAAAVMLTGSPSWEDRVDMSLMAQVRGGPNVPIKDGAIALRSRMVLFTSWLIERPEHSVVVVAPRALLRALLGVEFEENECRELLLFCTRSPPIRWQPVSPLD